MNADDFGLTAGVNRAIVEARTRGIVTSATLMANSQAFDEAVQFAKADAGWSVGCHVMLLDGRPLCEASRVSSLIESRNGHAFRDGVAGFAVRALTGRIDSEQVEAETTEQIRKLQSNGVTVSHVDTHKHTHMFPAALEGILRAARTCGITAIRNPFEVVAANFARAQTRLVETLCAGEDSARTGGQLPPGGGEGWPQNAGWYPGHCGYGPSQWQSVSKPSPTICRRGPGSSFAIRVM